MIRILHSVSNMDRAGIETMLMNYYRHIDRSKLDVFAEVSKRDSLAHLVLLGDGELMDCQCPDGTGSGRLHDEFCPNHE